MSRAKPQSGYPLKEEFLSAPFWDTIPKTWQLSFSEKSRFIDWLWNENPVGLIPTLALVEQWLFHDRTDYEGRCSYCGR